MALIPNCAVCNLPLPIKYIEESRASGKYRYPVTDTIDWPQLNGRIAHPVCLPNDKRDRGCEPQSPC